MEKIFPVRMRQKEKKFQYRLSAVNKRLYSKDAFNKCLMFSSEPCVVVVIAVTGSWSPPSFFFFIITYLSVFGCAGSSLLLRLFSSCGEQGVLSSFSVSAPGPLSQRACRLIEKTDDIGVTATWNDFFHIGSQIKFYKFISEECLIDPFLNKCIFPKH